jgi:hypothetical protein
VVYGPRFEPGISRIGSRRARALDEFDKNKKIYVEREASHRIDK